MPNNQVISADAYDRIFTMHGTTMVFLFVVPVMAAFGNYMVPLMIGARDMAFPRLNAASLWLLILGGLVMYLGFLWGGGAADAGWTAYPPLSVQSPGHGIDLWIVGLHIITISSVIGAVNFICTIHNMRAPGMRLTRMPLFVWTVDVYAFMLLLALPLLSGALTMLLLDRNYGTSFYAAGHYGPLLYQHLFWAFGHPEVYVVALPGFGMISEIVPCSRESRSSATGRSCTRPSRSRSSASSCGATTCSPSACRRRSRSGSCWRRWRSPSRPG